MHTIWLTVDVQVGGGTVGGGVSSKLEVGIGGTDLAERHQSGVTSRAAANLPTGAARDMVASAYRSDNILFTTLTLVYLLAVGRRKTGQHVVACQVGVIARCSR